MSNFARSTSAPSCFATLPFSSRGLPPRRPHPARTPASRPRLRAAGRARRGSVLPGTRGGACPPGRAATRLARYPPSFGERFGTHGAYPPPSAGACVTGARAASTARLRSSRGRGPGRHARQAVRVFVGGRGPREDDRTSPAAGAASMSSRTPSLCSSPRGGVITTTSTSYSSSSSSCAPASAAEGYSRSLAE